MDVQVRDFNDHGHALMVLMGDTEEERKAFIAMLGKLHISAKSKTKKLQSTTELVAGAIDKNIAQDAPSRNALNKLHSALSKALGEARKVVPDAEDTQAAAGDGGLTTLQEQRVEESVMADEEDVRMEGLDDEGVTEVQDSLLDELLDDEDE